MSVKVSQSGLLLDALEDNPNIKAVLLVDDRGYVVEQRGQAHSIKASPGEDATMITAKNPPMENLYLVSAGDEYLIVIFDDRLNFERLKTSVDTTLEQFDLRPHMAES